MPLKIAVLGFTQKVEKIHVPAVKSLKNSFVFSAVSDSSEERLRKAAEKLKGAAFYADEDLLLEKERPDAALLAGSSDRNRILKVLNANLDVFCDGALEMGLSGLDEILDKTRQRGKKLCFFRWWRHTPQVKAAAETVSQGILGNLKLLQWSFFSYPDRETAQSDSFRILNLLCGRTPINLFSKILPDGGLDTFINFLDLAVELHVSPKSRLKKVCALMAGDSGLLELNDEKMSIERPDIGRQVVEFTRSFSAAAEDINTAVEAYLDFKKTLADPSRAEEALKETALSLRLSAAARKSAATWKTVPV